MKPPIARPTASVPSSRALTALFTLGLAACGSALPPAGDPNFPQTADERQLSPLALLGKRLFEDARLSEPAGQSCASCHDAARAFQGNAGSSIAAVAAGSRAGVFGNRNVPSAMYAAFTPPLSLAVEADVFGNRGPVATGGLFLDGRAADLETQAMAPFLNPREMNNPSPAAVVAKVKSGPYAALARAALGRKLDSELTAYAGIAEAIAAFERTPRFAPFSSRFDDWLRSGAGLTAQELRGFDLFIDREKGNCLACHVGELRSREPRDWLFTDFSYDALGVPRNPEIPDNANPNFYDLGLCQNRLVESLLPGGVDVSELCGLFKVPTLRNVAVTAPYMHNGFFKELRDVVKFYVTRDTNPELWYPRASDGSVRRFDDLPGTLRANVNTAEPPYDRLPGQQPRLTEAEIDDVVAFLRTLTDRPFSTPAAPGNTEKQD